MLINYFYKTARVTLLLLLTIIYIVNGKDKLEKLVNSFIKAQFENIINSEGRDKVRGYNWIHRWLWNHRYDLDISNSNDNIQENSEWIRNNNEYANRGVDYILSQTSWVPVGPVNIPISFEPRSCYAMGRVNCLAFHPSDTNIIWIGTPGGGIWKTENGGKSWIPSGDNLPTLAISDIAVNPENPELIYIATGDFDAGSMVSTKAMGIFKSSDGGKSWQKIGESGGPVFGNSILRKILINPQNTNELIVGGRGGIWRSQDGGDSWTKVNDSLITDLEFNPVQPQIVYAAMGSLYGYYGSAGIMKSTDFGASWQELNTGIPPKEVVRTDISISPADPQYIYAICVSGVGNQMSGLHSFYLSTDGGTSWQLMANQSTAANILGSWDGTVNDSRGQGSYDLVLLADPLNKNKVYAGGVNIWVSENAGKDWEIASFWIYCFGVSTHADQHYAAYNPLNKNFYWCNDGGIYRTKEIKPGSKSWIADWVDRYEENKKPGAPDYKFPTLWENLTDGLAITEFYRLGLSKFKRDIVTGGSQDNSCYYYNNGEWINYIPNYDGMETMVDYYNSKIIYGVWQFGGLCKSTDGGKTIKYRLADTITSVHKERGNWITPVAMDPTNPEVIYIGFRNLWRSKNGGYLWEKVFDFDKTSSDSTNNNSLSIIKISYSNPDYISFYKNNTWYYNQQTGETKRVPGELWITTDRGLTWALIANGLPLDSVNITSIEYDDKNPRIMWVSTSSNKFYNNTYKTTDAGKSWINVSKPVPGSFIINSIVHQPESPKNLLYIGTSRGVYYSDDSLTEWLPFNENLPNAIINELEIQNQSKELYAATYGRGIWKTNLIEVTDVNDEKDNIVQFSILPNPSNGNFIIDFSPALDINNGTEVIKGEIINIRIIDVMGRTVYNEQYVIEGKSFAKEIKSGLVSGIYFIQLSLYNKNYSGKLIVEK